MGDPAGRHTVDVEGIPDFVSGIGERPSDQPVWFEIGRFGPGRFEPGKHEPHSGDHRVVVTRVRCDDESQVTPGRERDVENEFGEQVPQPRPMLGRLPWLAFERRRRALRFLVFFDIEVAG